MKIYAINKSFSFLLIINLKLIYFILNLIILIFELHFCK